MNEHLSSTPSTDHDKPSIPAAYRIYGEDRPDFEEGVGAAFWLAVMVLATVCVVSSWVAYLSLSTVTLFVATFGGLGALLAWWGCHWLASRMDRDDRKDKGEME